MKVLSNKRYRDLEAATYNQGYETAVKDHEKTICELKDLKVSHKELQDKINRLRTQVKVLEEEREEHRDMVLLKLANEDETALLDAQKEQIRKAQERLEESESLLAEAEEGNYKKGYADGIADGLRKVHEITAKDREDAMKIAMVSAASHTSTDNLKELNNVHQLTEGSKSTK